MNRSFTAIIILASIVTAGCKNDTSSSSSKAATKNPYQPKEYVQLTHPDWTKNATIYEVNIRQYTPEGTFKAFESHLQRLKDMA